MFYCKFKLHYDCSPNSTLAVSSIYDAATKREWYGNVVDVFSDMNEEIGCGKTTLILNRAKPNVLDMLAAIDELQVCTSEKILRHIEKYFAEQRSQGNYIMENIRVTHFEEITLRQFGKICEQINRTDYTSIQDYYRFAVFTCIHWMNDNDNYKLTEKICSSKRISYNTAKARAAKLLADESFLKELERIFSTKNARHFYGQPVHYKIVSGNSHSAQDLIMLLAESLYSNKRLTNRRVSFFSNITEDCYYEEGFERLMKNAEGGVVVIELSGDRVRSGQFANAYEEVVDFVAENVLQNCRNTLFVFVEIVDKPGFSGQLVARLQNDLNLIELQEGAGNRDEAFEHLKNLMMQSPIGNMYSDEELLAAMGDKLTFRASDIYQMQEKLYSNALKDKSYPAYREVSTVSLKTEVHVSDAYTEFKNLVGLKAQKDLIEQILAAHRVQKMRLDFGLDANRASLHMLFTGNPGSAKTTVSRLIAEILNKEGVLQSGRFVECGRADLVAKYVGWTAKAVCTKFNEARGGVLFIDEAYALSDGEHSTFGDEAIHTIVKEMENHRDDVIVIFAGYPDKMKEFLERNEGLRSRIAFHVDFPDYNVNELIEILKLMASKKKYILSEEVIAHCKKIFKRVVGKKDFGNGRFVRNLLEQAELRHARRITHDRAKTEITREDLLTLTVEDFKVNFDAAYREKPSLGFKF
ncbi:MAG: AAA family ATPase [Selenomonadaceae bacterium]|nr:AAA family ATPase [Selenomonadaceae bacterium]